MADYSFLENAGINSTEWKKDTFGCLSYRYKKTDVVLKLSQQLLKLNKTETITFFGEPDFKRDLDNEKEIFFYINEPNLYCRGKVLKESIKMLDITSIHFIFDKDGKMRNVGMRIP
jgi:hypothetical protein